MTVKEAIERGKEIAGFSLRSTKEYALKIYEILGFTNSKYYGHNPHFSASFTSSSASMNDAGSGI